MTNRILLFVLTALTAVALATTSARAEPTSDECLAKPKGQAPAGKHWYYQTNRTIGRKCWYLGDEGTKTYTAAPAHRAAAAVPAKQDQDVDVQPPIADARAELINEQAAEPPEKSAQQSGSDTEQVAPDSGNARGWTLASRWPDAPLAYSSDPTPRVSAPVQTSRTEDPPVAQAAAPPAPAAEGSVAVDMLGTLQPGHFAALMLLVVIVGAAIAVSSGSRRRRTRNVSSELRVRRDVLPGDEMRRMHSGATAARIEEIERLLTVTR